MRHFGAGPIRLSWYAIVLPALLLSYAGQTALLIQKGVIQGSPFFQLGPAWTVYRLVGLATVATIIASQSIVTGSFSMTRQAMQLNWLPGFMIRQTSDKAYGQIYVPVVNWMMMIATVGITLAFRSSNRLAGAYGTAVSTTMLLTTALLFTAMLKVWRWPVLLAAPVAGVFLTVDLGFFSANLLKIADGGWLPLSVGATIFLVMLTWRWGIDAVRAALARASEPPEKLMADLAANKAPRVPGTAIFLTRTDRYIPGLVADHARHMGALHEHVICLTIRFEEQPRIDDDERSSVSYLAEGICRVVLRFGFVEVPNLPAALKGVKDLHPAIDVDKAIFFAARDMVAPKPNGGFSPRLSLFAFLYRNAVRAVDRFSLPAANVIEIAREIEL